MSVPLQPATLEELVEAVNSAPQVMVVGAGTKPNLSAAASEAGVTTISTARLTGIVEYTPTEFTFTARAGTPLREIIAALAAEGQSLPFDPPLSAAGATVGGTVAAGFSGPGRLRFGGIRDFILGVRFVSGTGQLLRLGGKVVKNAAGFDLPKFFVGSLGRFGVLGELTFKVFPRPAANLTLEISLAGDREMTELIAGAAKGRWEIDALEVSLSAAKAYIRLAGPAGTLEALAADLGRQWPIHLLEPEAGQAVWQMAGDFSWAHPAGMLCKIPLTLFRGPEFAALVRTLPLARGWIGAAGNVGYLSLPAGADVEAVDARLRTLQLAALVWRGPGPLWLGTSPSFHIHAAVKKALDPQNRFLALR
jgi:glycolate oxidase FAD binding subunit